MRREIGIQESFGELIELRRLGEESVEGVVCHQVFKRWKPSEQPELEFRETWFIDPDNLVRRKTRSTVGGREDGMNYTADMVVRNIKTNETAIDNAMFTYTPIASKQSARQP